MLVLHATMLSKHVHHPGKNAAIYRRYISLEFLIFFSVCHILPDRRGSRYRVDKALEMPCNTWILHSTTRPTICIIQGKAQKYRNYRRHHDEHQLAIGHTHENTPHEIRKARNQRKDTNHTTTTQLCTLGPICNLIFFQLSSDLDKHHRISRNQHKSHTSSHFNSGRKEHLTKPNSVGNDTTPRFLNTNAEYSKF